MAEFIIEVPSKEIENLERLFGEHNKIDSFYGWKIKGKIIRCKDCKNKVWSYDHGNLFCKIHGDKYEDWFCADGERKDNG